MTGDVPSKHDLSESLADIIENAKRIECYLAGQSRADFIENGLVRDAVERCLERICEAAFRLGEHAVELMPAQPWPDIRGMGNRLRHAYDRISADIIWNAAQDDVPDLAGDARKVLALLQSARPGAPE